MPAARKPKTSASTPKTKTRASTTKSKSRTSASKATGSKTASVAQSTVPSTSEPNVVIVLDSAPSTPTEVPEKAANAEESLSMSNKPLDVDVQENANSLGLTITPEHEPSEQPTVSDKDDPHNVEENYLEEAAPVVTQKVKSQVQSAETQHTHDGAAASDAGGSPLLLWLAPLGRTGDELVEQAIHDLRDSVHVLWLGNLDRIFCNCHWIMGQNPNTWTLQWKPDAPNNPAADEGDAVIGVLGKVQLNGSALNPDAGVQPSWERAGLYKQKRTIDIISSGSTSNIPSDWFEHQTGGAKRLIENGRKFNNGTVGGLGNCFLHQYTDALRFRLPVFLPLPTAEECCEFGRLPPEPEASVREEYRYSTWKFDSRHVREAFNQVIARGFEPQHVPAYDQRNRLLHPNVVSATHSGAIAIVYFTIERALFNANSKSKDKPAKWQFFANLVKVQALKLADPTKSTIVSKRKLTHGYGPDDPSKSGGSPLKSQKVV